MKTNVGVQKIDGTTLKTYEIVVSTFSVADKDDREKFFKNSFLFADVKPNIELKISFLTISHANIDFYAWDLQWRTYITRDVLTTIRQVKQIGKKEFVAVALDPEYEAFMVHIITLSLNSNYEIYFSK